ncbi:MAG: electron transfer flavoprotein subunit alpha/FixB family protein, partial [Acidobacteriota bacterium]|nr:electron transfer flavoprotein subunit alpha/FixB family protein [Acidobacteriota bacterium]
MSAPVLCLVEHDDEGPLEASRRALAVARSLAESSGSALHAVVVGAVSAATSEALGANGVAVGHRLTGAGLDPYAPAAWARGLVALREAMSAGAVVAAGTDRGNEVLAHAGALADLPMVANCFSASRDAAGAVAISRQRWAGSLIEDSVLDSPVALLTVAFDGVSAAP